MRLKGIPVLYFALGALGLAMLGPALFALIERDWRSSRHFLYAGLFTVFGAAILSAASRVQARGQAEPRSELLALAGFFAMLPAFAAAPYWLLRPTLGYTGAYFEAVSALTTTGATLMDLPESTERALQLWRALLGWIGGFATLVAAAAILVPRNLIETPGGADARPESRSAGRVMSLGPGGIRVWRATFEILPMYLGLTAALTVLLALTSPSSFVALCHAMGVLSTSGISPIDGGFAALDDRWAELFAMLFMVAAASRLPYMRPSRRSRVFREVRSDPELRLLLLAVGLATGWLFARHWLGALTLSMEGQGMGDAFTGGFVALWGAVTTTVSFITTTGYASADWAAARNWSGLENPALMLLGLAALGGGVASTAGGIKLFRAYALFQHGESEIARLVHPHMVDTSRTPGGRLSRAGVLNAWIFVMLFLAALAVTMLALTLTGMRFDLALTAAIAALANTGPAFTLVEGDAAAYAKLTSEARMILCAAMVLGRIEVLALVALLNPGYWPEYRPGYRRR